MSGNYTIVVGDGISQILLGIVPQAWELVRSSVSYCAISDLL